MVAYLCIEDFEKFLAFSFKQGQKQREYVERFFRYCSLNHIKPQWYTVTHK